MNLSEEQSITDSQSTDSLAGSQIGVLEEMQVQDNLNLNLTFTVGVGRQTRLGSQSQQQPMPFGFFIPHIEENDVRLNGDIVNFSTVRLSNLQIEALNSTVKCRQTPRSLPVMELVAAAELAAKEMERSDVADVAQFRAECARIISWAKKPDSNIRLLLQRILSSLSKNDDLRVMSSDKGTKLVILNVVQYGEMCLTHLQDKAYEEVSEFGTGRREKFWLMKSCTRRIR